MRAVSLLRAVDTPSGRMELLGLSLAVSVEVRMVFSVVGGSCPVAMRCMMMERFLTCCG